MKKKKTKLGVAYGMGVDSTAVIVGLVSRGIRPDYILFADIGAEKEATYEYLPIIQAYLKKNGFPPVTVVKYTPKFAPYTTLEGNMVMNATLPGATFGMASCTVKFKIVPQEKWEKKKGFGSIRKAIGFDATEGYRKIRASNKAHTGNDGYEYWYPLIEWGWDREECKAQIRAAGLPVPVKSACIFCPNTKEDEFFDMTADERGRIVRVEVVAEPYNQKVQGLWRQPRKRDNRPGSITEYFLEQGISFTHPDDLPWIPLNPNCGKYKNGHTFTGPHNELRLAELIGGCKCSQIENHFHAEIIKSLP